MAPLREEVHSLLKVLYPPAEWFEREVSLIPLLRDLVDTHAGQDVF